MRRKSSFLTKIILYATIAVACYAVYQHRDKISALSELPGLSLPASGNLNIYALDVGQGDSLLIQTPGGKTILIDAGLASAHTPELLRKHNVTQLDLVVATHPHSDHIGGMKSVLNAFPVKRFLDSGRVYSSATYKHLLETIKQHNIPFTKAVRGQTIEVEPGIVLTVLNPGKTFLTAVRPGGSVENANSVMLRLTYQQFSMLFTGDAEFETEAEVIASGLPLRSQVLKVGHHGSRHATSPEFLAAVAPQIAIISVGAHNDYGHPANETLQRLKPIQTHRTDQVGEIHLVSDGKGWSLNSKHWPHEL